MLAAAAGKGQVQRSQVSSKKHTREQEKENTAPGSLTAVLAAQQLSEQCAYAATRR